MSEVRNSPSLADLFFRYAIEKTPSRKNRELAMLSPRDFMEIPQRERNIGWLGHCINRCPGYSLDNDVMNAAEKLIDNLKGQSGEKWDKFVSTLDQHPELISPPFPVLWLEWTGTLPPDHYAKMYGPDWKDILPQEYHNPSEQGYRMKLGLLLESLPKGAHGLKGTIVNLGEHNGFFPETNDQIRTYTIQGSHVQFYAGNKEENEPLSTVHISAVSAMSIMMILKSRTAVLKVVNPVISPSAKKIAKRIQHGRPPNKPLGRVIFDIARTLAKGRAANEEEAKRFLAEQIVMGHFKMREVRKRDKEGRKIEGTEHRLIWWNPFWRGGTEEEKAARKGQPMLKERAAKAIISEPQRPLLIPGYSITPEKLSKR